MCGAKVRKTRDVREATFLFNRKTSVSTVSKPSPPRHKGLDHIKPTEKTEEIEQQRELSYAGPYYFLQRPSSPEADTERVLTWTSPTATCPGAMSHPTLPASLHSPRASSSHTPLSSWKLFQVYLITSRTRAQLRARPPRQL